MAVVLSNPLRSGAFTSPVSGDEPDPLAFHRSMPGYARTPLVGAPGLAADLGIGALWVKDESSRFGLPAFKVLGASWACARLLSRLVGESSAVRSLDELRSALADRLPLRLVTATDGNHGRAVAHMAGRLGLDAHILMPAGTAAARVDAIAGEGAVIEVIDGHYDDAVALAAAMAGPTTLVVSDTSWPGYHDVPGWVIDGYSTIFREVDDELAERGERRPQVVVIQSGVGSLAAAAVHHHRRGDTGEPSIVVVEPTTADCALRSVVAGHPVEVPGPHPSIMAGLNCGTVSELAWPALAGGVDVFVGVDDPDAERAMHDLASIGVVAGETGGSGLAGLRALVEDGSIALPPDARVLVINTEGATDPLAYERIVGRPPG